MKRIDDERGRSGGGVAMKSDAPAARASAGSVAGWVMTRLALCALCGALGCGSPSASEARAEDEERAAEVDPEERALEERGRELAGAELADDSLEASNAARSPNQRTPSVAPSGDSLPVEPGEAPNFLATYHCVSARAPCTLLFETLRVPQRVDLGSGHAAAPRLRVELSVDEGRAAIGSVVAEEGSDASGVIESMPRASLEGGAYFVELAGRAKNAALTLRFESN